MKTSSQSPVITSLMPQLCYFHNLAFAYCHANSHSYKATDQNSSDDRSHSVPPLPPVDAFPLWPAEVIQKASHLQSSSCPPPSVCFSAQVNQVSSSRLRRCQHLLHLLFFTDCRRLCFWLRSVTLTKSPGENASFKSY